MDHVSIEKIYSYMEQQENAEERGAVEGHLATCEKCNSLYLQLISVERHLGQSFLEEKASSSCPEDWEVGALFQNELPELEAEKVSAHVEKCSFCIDRAAVFYRSVTGEESPVKSPEMWKQRAVDALAAARTVKEPATPLFQRLVDFISGLTFPVPAAAGYVTALLAVAVLAWIAVPDRDRFIILAGSEKLTVRSSEVPSAFGFSGAGETKELKGMNISLKGKEIVFQWEPLAGVEEYVFTLKEGTATLQDKKVLNEPRIAFHKDFLEREKLYSWLVTGTAQDTMYFEYGGDFLYAN